jgi:NAD(P)-dependent dehydrogenase (short-subunit alcohol dehydrogenase family)
MSSGDAMPSSNPLCLRARRVLVTGAASGIGRATCELLSGLEARVVAADIDREGLDALIGSLPGQGHSSEPVDLLDVDAIPAWVARIAEVGGPLLGVVHAAGVQRIQPLRLTAPAEYRSLLSLNTEAALALARGFQRKGVGEADGGSLVFISSVMASCGSPGAAAYSMSKAALHGLARSLAMELAPRRIRVNCVAPGFVRTPLFERVAALWDAGQFEQVEALHPLGFGEAADVANAIAFLLADTGRWVTGSVLTVDGGYSAH